MTDVIVIPPTMWENETGPTDWWAIETDHSIVAYACSEALAEQIAADIRLNGDFLCEICGEPAGAGGALCPVHLREAGIE